MASQCLWRTGGEIPQTGPPPTDGCPQPVHAVYSKEAGSFPQIFPRYYGYDDL